MSPEAFLVTFLTTTATEVATLVGERVHPGVAPQTEATPYISFFRISTPRIRSINGPSGLAYPRFQIEAWSEDFNVAKQVIDAVRRAIDGFIGTVGGFKVRAASVQDEGDDFDDVTRQHRARLDVMIWHDEATS
jgi:hypothetical protein